MFLFQQASQTNQTSIENKYLKFASDAHKYGLECAVLGPVGMAAKPALMKIIPEETREKIDKIETKVADALGAGAVLMLLLPLGLAPTAGKVINYFKD